MVLSWIRKAVARRSFRSSRTIRRSCRPLAIEALESRVVLDARTLGNLMLVTTGTFSQNASGLVSTTSPVTVEKIKADGSPTADLMRLDGGVQFQSSNNATGVFDAFGEIWGFAKGQAIDLVNGAKDHFLNAQSLLDKGMSIADSKQVSVAGAQFTLSSIALSDSGVALQGSIALPKLGVTVSVTGNDQVLLDSSGIHLTGLNVTLPTVSFTAGGVSFAASNLNIHYSSTNTEFDLSGSAVIKVGGQGVSLTLGSASTPGVSIVNGSLTSVNGTVTTPSLDLGAVKIDMNGLSVSYLAASGSTPEEIAITGRATLHAGGVDFSAQLGDAQNNTQGLVLQGGKLASLTGSVIGHVKVLGLDIQANNLGVSYNPSTSTVAVFGGLSLTVGSGDMVNGISATLGDSSKPGLQIVSGTVQSIDVTVNGNFSILGVTVAPKNLEVKYQNGGLLQFTGGLEIKLSSVFDATATLTDGGMTIDTSSGAVHINSIEATMDATLGSYGIKGLDIKYTHDDNGNPMWAAAGHVVFPAGFAVDGSLVIASGHVDSITLTYDAGNTSGIPIGDTAAFITHLGGSVSNLTDPSNLTVGGSLSVTYGKKITVLGQTVALFDASGSFTVSAKELDVTGTCNVAAGLLGSGTATAKLDWADGVYQVSVNPLKLYADAFELGGTVTFTSDGSLSLDVTGKAQIPPLLPVVGGKTLASAELDFNYSPVASSSSPNGLTVTATITGIGTVKFTEDFNGTTTLTITNGVFQDVYNVLANGFETLHDKFTVVLGSVAFKSLQETWDQAGNYVKDQFDAAGNDIKQTINYTWDAAVAGFDSVEKDFFNTEQTLEQDFTAGVKTLEKDFANGVETIEKDFSQGVQTLEKDFDAAGNYVQTTFANGVATVQQTFNSAGKAISFATGAISKGFTDTVNSAKQFFNTLGHLLGVVFEDLNGNGIPNAGEPRLAGFTIYADLNHNGKLDPGEPSVVSDANGAYNLNVSSTTPYVVRIQLPATGVALTESPGGYTVDPRHPGSPHLHFGVMFSSPVSPVPVTPKLYGATPSKDLDTAFVHGVYEAVLGHDASASQAQVWVNRMKAGMSRTAVAQAIENSSEHRAREVDQMSQTFLGHAASAAQRALWIKQLEAGSSESTVAQEILDSAVFQKAHQGAADYVQTLYQDVLGRSASAGEVAGWSAALGHGLSRDALVADLLHSSEAALLTVRGYEAAFLHQAMDEQGAGWAEMLQQGKATPTDVAVAILGSNEFFANGRSSVKHA